jgi:hypothetical protein
LHHQISRAYLCRKSLNEPPKLRLLIHDKPNEMGMKVQFLKINEWKINEKYYSQPIVSNGYRFYFFMRIEENVGSPFPYLGGYLRCITECDDPNHYLELEVTIGVLKQDGNIDNRLTKTITFNHCDRSAGIPISNYNWYQIKGGLSDIVTPPDNKITVIVRVKFL